MGNRLSKIYTRSGDDGFSARADGTRVAKNAPVMEVIGELDELNSHLGLLLSYGLPDDIRQILGNVQQNLFNLGAEISGGRGFQLPGVAVTELEHALDRYNESLPPLKEFILPGGSTVAAFCHIARAVCRRAERRLVGWINASEAVNPNILQYVNRLSDLLFVLARVLLRHEGQVEVYWRNPYSPS